VAAVDAASAGDLEAAAGGHGAASCRAMLERASVPDSSGHYTGGMSSTMARKPISELPDWELVHKEDDIRGKMLMDESGKELGKVNQMILDTDKGCVYEIVLENGRRYPADHIDVRGGRPIYSEKAMVRREMPHEEMQRMKERGETVMPLAEERLRIRKVREKAGDVEVSKEIVSQRETMEVPVTHEEVYVDEETIKARPADYPIGAGKDEVIDVPVYEEDVRASKETVVTREVHIGKEREEGRETISEELRHEEARIKRQGDVEVHEEHEGGEERERREEEERRRRAA